MFKNVYDCVSAFVFKAKSVSSFCYTALGVAMTTLLAAPLMAQETASMNVTVPSTGVDWSNVGQSVMQELFGPIGSFIGIAIAIWIVMMGVAALRKTVKV